MRVWQRLASCNAAAHLACDLQAESSAQQPQVESDSVSESKRALREELSKDAETRWKERAENAARARAARGQACSPACTRVTCGVVFPTCSELRTAQLQLPLTLWATAQGSRGLPVHAQLPQQQSAAMQ